MLHRILKQSSIAAAFLLAAIAFHASVYAAGMRGRAVTGQQGSIPGSGALPVVAIPVDPTHDQHGLSPKRFHELRYGISFAQPAGTHRVLQTADGAIVKYLFPGPGDVAMGFYIRHSTGSVTYSRNKSGEGSNDQKQSAPLTIDIVKKQAVKQFSFAYPSARRIKILPDIKPAGRPGAKLYFLVTDKKGGNWVAGQAFMMIDPHTVAMFQMQCGSDQFDHTRAIFEAMLQSVKMQDPRKLDQVRRRSLMAGQAWLKTITPQRLAKSLVAQRWYRIRQGGKDVGFERVSEQQSKDLSQPGIKVVDQMRVYAGTIAFDSLGSYFASNDGSTEVWSVRTTRRDADQAKTRLPQVGAAPQDAGWAETGLRSGTRITVSKQSPSSIKRLQWVTPSNPPGVYLSQVDLHSAMRLLPHEKAGQFAFYAYDSQTGKLSLRLVSVQPLSDGGFRTIVRPGPDRAPITSKYSNTGKLLRRTMPDGRVILATTRGQLREVWHLPEPKDAPRTR